MNYKMIIYILANVLKIEGACMLVPLICAFCYRETAEITVFSLCIAICVAAGLLLSLRAPKNKVMYAKEGFVTVALCWIFLSIFGALPFMLSNTIPNFFNAFFETVSGFTTTGASILNDVEVLPKSVLMWRSFTHWIGGMGVLVFLMAILPQAGAGSIYLLKAESPGPSVSKLVPKLRTTAMVLYGIYIALTVLEIILLLSGGMDLFDSITLSFGTAGTGGFSIRNSGLSEYSAYSQYVITVFMILFGIDFSIYYAILLRGIKSIFRSEELRAYLGIVALSTLLIFLNCLDLYSGAEEAFRNAWFTVGSIITTTGYAISDFNLWHEFSKGILLVLMFTGACAGSTGGGIKVSRIIILFKSIVKEIRTYAHPRTTLKIKMNGKTVEHETVRGVNVYMSAYVIIFFASFLLISLDTFDFTTNFTAIATTLNNVGPGFNVIGPMGNFSGFSSFSKLIMSGCMLIGRLEIFPMLLLLSPYAWKKY